MGARLRWLHTAATPLLTWYGAHDKHGQAEMDSFGILPAFQGVAVHDGWASYRDYACTHALCNAHHSRANLSRLEETTEQAWPRKIESTSCARPRTKPMPRSWPSAPWQERGSPVCAANTKPFHRPRRTGQCALRPYPETAWPYQAIPRGQSSAASAPARRRCPAFSRRLACALRQRRTRYPHVHAQAKDSGCFRTVTGVESFCTIRSYLATLRKQGRNVFHILTLAFQGQAPDPLPSG